MTRPRILVTSAAGRTGAAAVFQLLEKGFPVRAFVRRRDARAEELARAGAELFVGDLFDFEDLRNALRDVQRAYHCPPFAPHQLHNAMLFALAAEEAKLEVVALMSSWNAHANHPSIVPRDHWIAANLYRWMPTVDAIHINPGLFAFTYLLGLPVIVHFGMLALPWGKGLNPPPSNEDIASVAVGALIDPKKHVGKSYRPTGPTLLSPEDVARILTKVLRRKVKYYDVPMKMLLKATTAQGFPRFEIAQIRHFSIEHRGGAFAVGGPTDHVREVGGKEPEGFESIARRYIANPTLIHPNLSVGTKVEAFRFMLRMLLTPAPNLDAWERSQGHVVLKNPALCHDSREWRSAAERQRALIADLGIPRATPMSERIA